MQLQFVRSVAEHDMHLQQGGIVAVICVGDALCHDV
jgi:hypothetical protein